MTMTVTLTPQSALVLRQLAASLTPGDLIRYIVATYIASERVPLAEVRS